MIANPDAAATTFSPRVMELRKKIHDEEWVDFAVQRIAQVLSRRLVEGDDQIFARTEYETVAVQ